MSDDSYNPTVPPDDDPPISMMNPSSGDALGKIGPYQLLSVLGEGGMGVVYKAEQRHPVRRIVALKLIKLGMDTREVIARFEAERQALAMMDHPNVARVYDAGASELGRPYFVMEYVAGEPINEYCDKMTMTTRQRLELFIQVCDAVQHAHMKGVVHRDLKPTNILVSLQDGQPKPKIIDFGVAKATTQRLTERTLFTEQGQLIGTPEYMSPEQAEMSGLDVDTRTDIYSLGVVLYELLAGALPFDSRALRKAAFAEIQRIIREVDPPRPSVRLSSLGLDAEKVARRCGVDRRQLNRELRRELDWIPLKAMRKDRTDRYRTAAEMADDIRNYLVGKPLIAAPESAIYRARKFARRNRWALATAGLLLLALLAGLTTTAWQAYRATRAEAQALLQKDRERDRFNDVRKLANVFMIDVHDKVRNLPGSTAAVRLLVSTSLEYLSKLADDAGDDPTLLRELAVGYSRMGDIQGNPKNGNNLGDLTGAMTSYKASDRLYQKLAEIEGMSVTNQDELWSSQIKFADIEVGLGNLETAIEHLRKAEEIATQMKERAPNDSKALERLSTTYERLGDAFDDRGDASGALDLHVKSLEIRLALPQTRESPRLQWLSYTKIGHAYQSLGKYRDAQRALIEGATIIAKSVEADANDAQAQRDLVVSLRSLGDLSAAMGEYTPAADYHLRALAILKSLSDADPEDVQTFRELATQYSKLGDVYWDADDLPRATEAFQLGLTLSVQALARNPKSSMFKRDVMIANNKVGHMHRLSERYEDAAATFGIGLGFAFELARDNPTKIDSQSDLAIAYQNIADVKLMQEKWNDALSGYLAALEVRQKFADDPAASPEVRRGLAINYERLGMVYEKLNDRTNSSDAHLKRLRISRDVAMRVPADVAYQRDWFFACYLAGNAELAIGEDASRPKALRTERVRSARSLFVEGLGVANRMKDEGKLGEDDADSPKVFAGSIAKCDAVLAELTGRQSVSTAPATNPSTAPGQ